MCDISGIGKNMVKNNEKNSIGAQYIMKGLTHYYWDRVERECEVLFKDVNELNQIKKQADPTHHELQIWCADMWAVLWNGWKMGVHTECHPNMEFSWATSTEEDYLKMNIFHNAGITGSEGGRFYKAQYMNKLPYGDLLDIEEGTASWHYYQWVRKVGQKSVLI
jgi:hypothetical protein